MEASGSATPKVAVRHVFREESGLVCHVKCVAVDAICAHMKLHPQNDEE